MIQQPCQHCGQPSETPTCLTCASTMQRLGTGDADRRLAQRMLEKTYLKTRRLVDPCVKGHDIAVVGRSSARRCRECSRIYAKTRYWSLKASA